LGIANAIPNRLLFLDNLKWVLIVLVVTVHAAVTYGPVGGWFYHQSTMDPLANAFFMFYSAFMQAFFMGLFFMISGYFVPAALNRKGPMHYVKERVKRLAIPALIFIFLIAPLIIYPLYYAPLPFLNYYTGYASNFWALDSGPLWFAIALLVFSIAYVIYKQFAKAPLQQTLDAKPLGNAQIAGLVALITVSSFVVRLFFPIGTAVWNMQLCFFSQYIVLFAVGIIAYQRNWFMTLSNKVAKTWLNAALISTLIVMPMIALTGGFDNFSVLAGGLNWQAAALVIWEQIVGVGMCIGLIVYFRERNNKQGKRQKSLSDNAFSIFLFHAPFVVFFGVLFSSLEINVLVKFVAVATLGFLSTLAFSQFIVRRIPYLKKVL
jgi:glucans biosynthesis protein C